jgi:hypothetical protein
MGDKIDVKPTITGFDKWTDDIISVGKRTLKCLDSLIWASVFSVFFENGQDFDLKKNIIILKFLIL